MIVYLAPCGFGDFVYCELSLHVRHGCVHVVGVIFSDCSCMDLWTCPWFLEALFDNSFCMCIMDVSMCCWCSV